MNRNGNMYIMSFGLFLDIIMLFLLAGTIYFVARLSDNLSRFRSNRAEMERLVRDLNLAISGSQTAILSLRETAQDAGDDLQKTLRKATEMADELQMMTESANAIASRLEKVASGGGAGIERDVAPTPVARPVSQRADPDSEPHGFFIRDVEFDGTRDTVGGMDSFDDDDLQSDAERELARALKHKSSPRMN